jgi:Family of unknown function (DUF5317)
VFILFLAAAALGALVVVLRTRDMRGDLGAEPDFPRHAWLLLVAIVLQQLWVRWISHQPSVPETFAWLVALSYVPLVAFIFLNRERLAVKVIAIGVVLNFSAMLANGGAMPVPARFASSTQVQTSPRLTTIAPGTKDRLVDGTQPALVETLSDHILVTLPTGIQRVASFGDFFILTGGILALVGAIWQPNPILRRRRISPALAES